MVVWISSLVRRGDDPSGTRPPATVDDGDIIDGDEPFDAGEFTTPCSRLGRFLFLLLLLCCRIGLEEEEWSSHSAAAGSSSS